MALRARLAGIRTDGRARRPHPRRVVPAAHGYEAAATPIHSFAPIYLNIENVLHLDGQLWSGSLDFNIRVWEIGTGRCLGTLRGPSATNPAGTGHTNAVSCLALLPGAEGGETYIASGGLDGDVKLWRTNGEFAHSCNQGMSVTCLGVFQDTVGGVPLLMIGLMDGRIMMRSAITMELLVTIDGQLHQNRPVWDILNVGQSCFATAGDSGFLTLIRVVDAIVGSS